MFMAERFLLQRATQDGWFVVTDKANGVVIKFERFKFNETQQVTLLEDIQPDAYKLAKIMNEIADWLATHHYFDAMPFDNKAYSLFWAKKIKALREEKGWSRYKLSAESHKLFGQGNGVNENHLMQIERGEHSILLATLYKVLATLGYDLDAIEKKL